MYYFQKVDNWIITQKKANLGSFLLAETKMMSIFALPIL